MIAALHAREKNPASLMQCGAWSCAAICYAAAFFFFGLPPFFPLARAAEAFAADVVLPPILPRACAALFMVGLQSGVFRGDPRIHSGAHLIVRVSVVEGDDFCAEPIAPEPAVECLAVVDSHLSAAALNIGDLDAAECSVSVHGDIIPNRLGFAIGKCELYLWYFRPLICPHNTEVRHGGSAPLPPATGSHS